MKGGGEKRDRSVGRQVWVGNSVEPDGEVSTFVSEDEDGGDDGKSKENDCE